MKKAKLWYILILVLVISIAFGIGYTLDLRTIIEADSQETHPVNKVYLATEVISGSAVDTGSMLPTLGYGDTISYVSVKSLGEVSLGDIVVVSDGDEEVIHRVVEKGIDCFGSYIKTKGDANVSVDKQVWRDSNIRYIVVSITYGKVDNSAQEAFTRDREAEWRRAVENRDSIIAWYKAQPAQVVEHEVIKVVEVPKIITETVIKEVAVSDKYSFFKDWTLGDSVVPSPWQGSNKLFDCDDFTLYSYYWISFIRPEYQIQIMYGDNPDTTIINGKAVSGKHVWLIVGSDNVTLAYDGGNKVDLENSPKYLIGIQISLKQLVNFVSQDNLS